MCTALLVTGRSGHDRGKDPERCDYAAAYHAHAPQCAIIAAPSEFRSRSGGNRRFARIELQSQLNKEPRPGGSRSFTERRYRGWGTIAVAAQKRLCSRERLPARNSKYPAQECRDPSLDRRVAYHGPPPGTVKVYTISRRRRNTFARSAPLVVPLLTARPV